MFKACIGVAQANEGLRTDWLQQLDEEHDLKGEGMDTRMYNGRRWYHSTWIQYALDPKETRDGYLQRGF